MIPATDRVAEQYWSDEVSPAATVLTDEVQWGRSGPSHAMFPECPVPPWCVVLESL